MISSYQIGYMGLVSGLAIWICASSMYLESGFRRSVIVEKVIHRARFKMLISS